MFQEFPYTNFHELNLDWIVKIAKDFLDQYTHIQEVIQTGLDDLAESRETGLADLAESRATGLAELNQKTLDGLVDLQEKYDTFNGLLQAWYDTHSADIAGQLADAIADFNAAAEAKSQALLDSWPADYSELVTSYNNLKSAFNYAHDNLVASYSVVDGLYINASGVLTRITQPAENRTICVEGTPNKKYYIKKATTTIMRAGCGSSDSLSDGDSLANYTGFATASSDALVVETDSVNKYIYVQLFVDSDSSDLKTISANIGSLVIIENTNEEIENVEKRIDEILYVGNVTVEESANKYLYYQIQNGHKYRITSSSSAVITVSTADDNNQTIQNVGNTTAGNNKTLEFTATGDSTKVLFFFRAAGTATIEDLNKIIPTIEKTIEDMQTVLNTLPPLEENWDAYNSEINRQYISAPAMGNYYVSYPVTKGHIYKITTTSETNSVTVATVDANNTKIEDIATLSTGTHSVIFIPTENADKIWYYFRADGHGTIIEETDNMLQWLGKVWSCYGDSISWNYGWQPLVCNLLGFNDWVRNGKPGSRISWVDSTFGIDANGIYTTGVPVDTVHESLCAYDRISKTIDNTLPLIFVMGGTNDFLSSIAIGDLTFNASSETDSAWHTENAIGDYDISTLKGALASMFMKLQYHAPNALIVFGTLCNGIGESTGDNQYAESVNTASLKPSDYAKAEKEVCEIFGIPYIDVFGECGINITNRATYISDTVHPNDEGIKLLARCVASGLKCELPR